MMWSNYRFHSGARKTNTETRMMCNIRSRILIATAIFALTAPALA
jgi:hypothetical protein